MVPLCSSLFWVRLTRLGEMFLSLLKPINFQTVTFNMIFCSYLGGEIFPLLIIYLQEQRILIQAAVEASLVSALREENHRLWVDGLRFYCCNIK